MFLSSKSKRIRSNGFLSYFDTLIYQKILGVQYELGLGRSFPILYLTIEGLNALGKLAPEEYEFYKLRYTAPLESIKPSLYSKATKSQDVVPKVFAQTREAECKSMNNFFKSIIDEWDRLSAKARKYHLKTASRHPTLKYAKQLVKLGAEENGEI